MYLKKLTLRGFKSFASATTLVFEPGITCVVGPNGSGKSNVVDALSWVMGSRGQDAARRQDGRRHLRGHVQPGTARPRRGRTHHRQLGRCVADRVHRGDDHPHHVPQRGIRVRHQRRVRPAPRRAGVAERLRHRPRDARHRRAGPARRHPAGDPGVEARVHRGGRRRPQAPQT
ncbi:AAA family ATPase [Tessaracoccus coleopterorum]|uniref:AAA family ATPase n=1 Tax=Tessaracoccus coleopterorum TaxID=2714950 RepID=UPI0038CD1707